MMSLKDNSLRLNIITKKTSKEALKTLAFDLYNEIIGADTDILFLTSGGSVLEALDFFTDDLSSFLEKNSLTVSVLDERFDPTNKNSNFTQFKDTLFYKSIINHENAFEINTESDRFSNKEELADYFNDRLKWWVEKYPSGKIIATAGIGKDGHTAGIIPGMDENEFKKIFFSERFAVAYTAKNNPYPERVTTTFTFLKLIFKVFIYVSSKEKVEALRSFLRCDSVLKTPASFWNFVPSNLYIDSSTINLNKYANKLSR